jgi:hypothetical protein
MGFANLLWVQTLPSLGTLGGISVRDMSAYFRPITFELFMELREQLILLSIPSAVLLLSR